MEHTSSFVKMKLMIGCSLLGVSTDVSEEHIISIFRVEEISLAKTCLLVGFCWTDYKASYPRMLFAVVWPRITNGIVTFGISIRHWLYVVRVYENLIPATVTKKVRCECIFIKTLHFSWVSKVQYSHIVTFINVLGHLLMERLTI
jgi:hypothetical protein